MKKYLLVFVVSGILHGNVQAQAKERIVARAGKSEITSSEFTERFGLTPWPKMQNGKAAADAQTGFVRTLVAEKLLSMEAEQMGLDTTKEIHDAFHSLEKMYLRDALFKQEITKKVILPLSAQNNAAEKNRYLLKLGVLSSASADEISRMAKDLKKGVPFDSVSSGPALARKDTLKDIKYGDLNEGTEEAVFSLKPGAYTDPIKEKNVWLIFKLIQKTDRIVSGGAARDQIAAEALKKLRERETNKVYQDYYRRFFKGKKVESNGLLFFSFCDKVITLLSEKKNAPGLSEKDRRALNSGDFARIEHSFGTDSLNLAFAVLDSEPVRLKTFIKEFENEGFFAISDDPVTVRMQIDSRVKRFIELELLSREAYRKGLQNLPEVKRSLKYWKESYLAQKLKGMLMDSLSVSGEKEKNSSGSEQMINSRTMVNIIELISDSLPEVESILNELNSNADFGSLAARYGKSGAAGIQSGETGWVPADSKGEIGRIALGMRPGEIYGPLKTDKGYLLFKLIGKKEAAGDTLNSAVSRNDGNDSSMIARRYTQKLTEFTAGLAKKYGFSIDEKALAESGALNLNIFAFRYMGFGGRVMAVPYTVPFTEWFENWKESGSQLP